MTTAVQPAGAGGGVERPSSSSLADVIDTILDKGLVIDAYVRVSLVGIELLTIDARVVVASVDTYLRFADAVNRLDISDTDQKGLPDLLDDATSHGTRSKTRGALEGVGEKLRDLFGDEDSDNDREPARRGRRRQDGE